MEPPDPKEVLKRVVSQINTLPCYIGEFLGDDLYRDRDVQLVLYGYVEGEEVDAEVMEEDNG